jgi:hypothetical protein
MAKITIEESELDARIAKAVKEANAPKEEKRKKDNKKYAFLRKLDGKYVVDFEGGNQEVKNADGSYDLYTTSVFNDGKKKKMSWTEIRNLEREKVEVKIEALEPTEIEGDPIRVIEYKEWKRIEKDDFVEDVVVIPNDLFKVKTSDGEFEVNTNAINI